MRYELAPIPKNFDPLEGVVALDYTVPIVETRHLMPMTDSPYQCLMDTLTVWEYENRVNNIKQWWDEHVPKVWRNRTNEERRLIHSQINAWLAEGASVSQLLEATSFHPKSLYAEFSTYSDADWASIWEEMWKGQAKPMSLKFGVSVGSLRKFAVKCGAWLSVEEWDETLRRRSRNSGRTLVWEHEQMCAETPSAQWEYNTIMSKTRRAGKQRA
jgi:hypothetical protein